LPGPPGRRGLAPTLTLAGSDRRVLKLLDNGAPLRSLTKGKGPLTGLGGRPQTALLAGIPLVSRWRHSAGCHQLDLQDDSGDQLEDWMEASSEPTSQAKALSCDPQCKGMNHYLDDDNGDSSQVPRPLDVLLHLPVLVW
jgi:hypothetical protein